MPPSRRIKVAVLLLALVILPFLFVFAVPVGRAASGKYTWPVSGSILRGFEKPTGPYGEGGHQGVDLAAEPGEQVHAAEAGKVAWVGELPRGRFISVSHSGGVRTTYLDLASINVSAGDRVSRGQVIGTVCGTRDGSSTRSHLHFDTYLNGTPVDPCLLLRGFDAGSYVRLCPVKRTGSSGPGGGTARDRAGQRQARSSRSARRAPAGGNRSGGPVVAVTRFFSSAWRGTCELACWIGRGCQKAWSGGIYPVLRGVAAAARWAWGNRYVQAVAAGLAAALIVVIGVVAALILLPISTLTAVIAAVGGALVCIGTAVYYAATSGADFSFGACFVKSLTVGGVAATAVVCWGALSWVAEMGWAAVGLSGITKVMFAGGAFSAVFDGCVNYLLTGRISLKGLLISFVIGAVTAGIGTVLKRGMTAERLVQAFSVAEAETTTAVSVTGRAVVIVKETTVRVQVFLIYCKELALTFGGRIAYVTFSGSLTAGINVLTCLATHKPITLSGVFASFLAGAAMGGIALTFGGEGINGLLSRFPVFRGSFGTALRKFLAKVINRSISKGIKNGLEDLFERVLKEEEVSR